MGPRLRGDDTPGNWGVIELHEGLDSGDGRRDGVLQGRSVGGCGR